MTRPIVVIKVGGSLLDWPELPTRLADFLENHRGNRVVLVVGGGRFAEVLRELDAVHQIGELHSHALALRVLDFTADLLARLVPETRVVADRAQLDEVWSTLDRPILAPRRFLDADDLTPDPLPHAWTTTTDSIAARLALRLEAHELVLLKSITIPAGIDLKEAARLGYVDSEFPRAAEELPLVTFHNLREAFEARIIGTDPQSW